MSGWPAKRTPNMSKTSRSGQLAARKTPVEVGTAVASSVATLSRMRRWSGKRCRW